MRTKQLFRLIPLLLAALCLLFLCPTAEAAIVDGSKIAKGVKLGDVDLGGKTLEEATNAVEEYCNKLAASKLTIEIYGKEEGKDEEIKVGSYTVALSELGFTWSAEESLHKATTFGQKGRLIELYKNLQDLQFEQVILPLECSVKADAIRAYVENTLVPQVNCEPVDATVSLEGKKVVVSGESKYGTRINAAAAAESIYECFANGIPAELVCRTNAVIEKPHYLASDLAMIDSILGECTTYVNTASTHTDRNSNIALEMSRINGHVVMPGERFSVVDAIIPVTLADGYKYAGAYENGRSVMQVGGGICQGSTTLYGAVLEAELRVILRYNHSMLIDYRQPSFDAAIYEVNKGKDFVFENDSEYPIYIEAYFQGDRVVAKIHGHETRDKKHRKVEYVSTILSQTPYSPKYIFDNSANPGDPSEEGHYLPKTISTLTKIVTLDGVVQSEDILYKDEYRQCEFKVTIGTNMFPLHTQKDDQGLDRLYTSAGDLLLTNGEGVPYYNGSNGYLLAKNYKCDKYGVAELDSNGRPKKINSDPPATKPVETTTPEETEHVHDYVRTVLEEDMNYKTTEDGEYLIFWDKVTYTCECGDSYTVDEENHRKLKEAETTPEETTEPPVTEPPETEHEHSYSSEVTKEPTCTEVGIRTYTCSKCGDSYTEEIAALGHQYNDGEITKAPTCTESGVKTFTCSRCGATYTEDIAAAGHQYSSEVSYTADPKNTPTTSLTGYKTITYGNCSVCGDSNHPADTQEEIGTVNIVPNETTWGETKAQLNNVHLTYWFRKAGTKDSVNNVDESWTVAEIYYNFNNEGKGSVIVYVNVPDDGSGSEAPSNP